MSFVAAESPPIHIKSTPGSTSGTEGSDSDSDSDGSENGDIPNFLPGTNITAPSNNLSEDNFEHDILAQFLGDDDDSQDPEQDHEQYPEQDPGQDPENDKADEPDYLIKSDIVDPSEISIDAVREVIAQLTSKPAKNGATAAMLGMQRKHSNEASNTRDVGPSHAAAQHLAIQNRNQVSLSSPAFLVQPVPHQRVLQVPIPADLGWEDAMTLRRALQEMAEQLVFAPHGNKVVRKVLREFSGALEDFASEDQE
ncbi:hypothetical protein PspLS_08725 [Pyricularia sp. CBS 133598]|nr:hypothetical protein PspLS_08725 [Pyricularia sp. CBS 133598]